MEYQRVYLGGDKSVRIECPSCQHSKSVPVEKLPEKFYFIVKCRCGAKFVVQRELRSRYRRNIHLTGSIKRADMDGKALNDSSENPLILGCIIINISPIGAGLFLTGRAATGIIKVGDILRVQFNLDNSVSTRIEKMVTVKAVKNNYVGCEFHDNEKEDKDIKFYLL